MGTRIIRVENLDDPRLDAYARLTERELRCVLEPERGIFIAESAKVIERAVAAGLEPVSFFMAERWLGPLEPLFERVDAACAAGAYRGGAAGAGGAGAGAVGAAGAGAAAAGAGAGADPSAAGAPAAGAALGAASEPEIPVFVAPEALMEQLTGFAVTRGALAAFRRPRLAEPGAFLRGVVAAAGARPVRVCVLEGIVDHTNVGAIFRSAAALNVDGVLVAPTCCDPLYRRAVRVSMGTVFQVPWTRLGTTARAWPADGLAALHEAGFTCAAMALADDSRSLDDPSLAEIDRLALFMGTEGEGLTARTIAGCDLSIRIPMAHGVDSLNVAAASAVAFWQLCPHVGNDYRYQPGLY